MKAHGGHRGTHPFILNFRHQLRVSGTLRVPPGHYVVCRDPQPLSTLCRKANFLVLAMNRTKSPPLSDRGRVAVTNSLLRPLLKQLAQLNFRYNLLIFFISLLRFRKRRSTCLPVAMALILGSDFAPPPPPQQKPAEPTFVISVSVATSIQNCNISSHTALFMLFNDWH
jgi:hypothetical protein